MEEAVKKLLFVIVVFIFSVFFVPFNFAYAVQEHVEGLEYLVKRIDEPPIEKNIAKHYDLYEIYFENRSTKTYSIPGYSIDLGIDYSTLSEVRSFFRDKTSNKLTVLNVAAGAASIALGGVARQAASTVRSATGFRRKNILLNDVNSFLSPNHTYIIYPGDGLSLFLLLNKYLGQVPNTMRFICHEEDTNTNIIVISNQIEVRQVNFKKEQTVNKIDSSLATPSKEHYK